MQKVLLFLFIFSVGTFFSQKSDFSTINFSIADNRAKSYKNRNLLKLNEFTFKLTKGLPTDVEKFRAIYIWITHNIENDFRLYALNKRKRDKFKKDSIKLFEWNSQFKKKLFKKLLKRKRTICSGYAYLLKEMCDVVGIDVKIVNGFGRSNDMDLEDLEYPNHAWNIVKLNEKWYLCDPTWASGISYPDENKFVFKYNDGLFLTPPKLFFQTHFPINKNYSLLNDQTPTLKEFAEMPFLYGNAYNYLDAHVTPKVMYHEIKQNQTFTFQYQLKKKIDLKKVKLIFTNTSTEKTIKPKITLQNKLLNLEHKFSKRGYYDVHFYVGKDIIATYTFKIVK